MDETDEGLYCVGSVWKPGLEEEDIPLKLSRAYVSAEDKLRELRAMVRRGEELRTYMDGMGGRGPFVFPQTMRDYKQLVYMYVLEDAEICEAHQNMVHGQWND